MLAPVFWLSGMCACTLVSAWGGRYLRFEMEGDPAPLRSARGKSALPIYAETQRSDLTAYSQRAMFVAPLVRYPHLLGGRADDLNVVLRSAEITKRRTTVLIWLLFFVGTVVHVGIHVFQTRTGCDHGQVCGWCPGRWWTSECAQTPMASCPRERAGGELMDLHRNGDYDLDRWWCAWVVPTDNLCDGVGPMLTQIVVFVWLVEMAQLYVDAVHYTHPFISVANLFFCRCVVTTTAALSYVVIMLVNPYRAYGPVYLDATLPSEIALRATVVLAFAVVIVMYGLLCARAYRNPCRPSSKD